MTAIVIAFPGPAQVVPIARYFPSEETVGAMAAFDQRHRLRWYDLGASFDPQARFYHWAESDGREFLNAYLCGVMARLFGVSLMECVL